MNVVMVSSEVAPFSKSGGLGDVAGALSRALARAGHRVMTVSPRYGSVDPERWGLRWTGHNIRVAVGRWDQVAGLHVAEHEGVTHVFVEHGMFHRAGLYGDHGGAYGDNHVRFALLSRAGLQAARQIPVDGELLGDEVVFHCNDWQTSLVPIYLEAYYRPLALFEQAGTVLTLHNPAHQGRLPADFFADLELPQRWFTPWGLEFYGDLGLLKAGIQHTDQLTSVSPTFAREITWPGGGFGLEGVIASRAADLTGILNGIDTDEWNPAADPHLAAAYTADDLSGKRTCKAALQSELGLPVEADAPLVGSVGRLDPQKGVELILDSIPWLVAHGAQVVVLGSAAGAHQHYEQQLRELEARFPHHVRAWIGFSEAVAHRIEAGADLFAMPSLFEPCGLNQMYSMRYGTPPVVRRTGGLADSVTPYDASSDSGTGFVFDEPSGWGFRGALHHALSVFRTDRAAFDRIRQRGMRVDWSWDRTVPAYTEVYERALSRHR